MQITKITRKLALFRSVAIHFFHFKPKLYSVSQISNFANIKNNNNSQLNFHAQNYFKVLLC